MIPIESLALVCLLCLLMFWEYTIGYVTLCNAKQTEEFRSCERSVTLIVYAAFSRWLSGNTFTRQTLEQECGVNCFRIPPYKLRKPWIPWVRPHSLNFFVGDCGSLLHGGGPGWSAAMWEMLPHSEHLTWSQFFAMCAMDLQHLKHMPCCLSSNFLSSIGFILNPLYCIWTEGEAYCVESTVLLGLLYCFSSLAANKPSEEILVWVLCVVMALGKTVFLLAHKALQFPK